MKRYGEKATKELLKNGYYITYFEWFNINSGYKITDKDYNIIGYITFDLWLKLKNQDVITSYMSLYDRTVYGLVY